MTAGEDDIPAPKGAPDRTVIASADMLAAMALPSAPPIDPSPAETPVVHGAKGSLIGVHLNDMFEITRFISEGGMGEVYEGRNITSDERVAIKIILPQFASDAQFMAMFRREAGALQKLGHDALVKYRTFAFDRAAQLNYLALEYVEGPKLSDILLGQHANPATVRVVLRRLANGLAAAHDLGVIHRDLSPDNILLPDGDMARAKVIDFGIVKDTLPGGKTLVGDVFAGKFGYAAPEVFGKYGRDVGPWTDVYSLALTVLAYAKGDPVDMGVTMADAFDARAQVPDLGWLSPGLVPIFSKMLEPDPQVRLRSMHAVIEAIDAPIVTLGEQLRTGFDIDLLDQVPAVASVTTAPTASPAFVRREANAAPATHDAGSRKNRMPLIGGVAAAVLALGAGGYFAFAPKPTVPPVVAPEQAASIPTAGTAAPAKLDWATARPQLVATLADTPCSDIRIAGDPHADGSVRLTGWRPSGAPVLVAPTGYTLDLSGVASVAQPHRETCRVVDALRAAVPSDGDSGFAQRASQTVSMATARNGLVSIDLGASAPPTGKPRLLLLSIDDNPGAGEQRLVSAPVGPSIDPAALPFEKKVKLYLTALVAAPTALPALQSDADIGKLSSACAGKACAMTSGWVNVAP